MTKARAWTRAEARGIRSALPDRYRIISGLGVQAGERLGEALGFSEDDIDEERMVLHVRRQLQWEDGKQAFFKLPKGDKEREVPLSTDLLRSVRTYCSQFPSVRVTLPWRGPGNGGRKTATVRLLITTRYGNPINPSSFNDRVMKPALAAAGLIAPRQEGKRWGWEASRDMMHHRWRHTYASIQLGAGKNPISVAHWMGHASPTVTLRVYAHFMPQEEHGQDAVDVWMERAAPMAQPASRSMSTIEPYDFCELTPLALPALTEPIDVLVRGARYGDAWIVGMEADCGGPHLGDIRTEPGDDPVRVLRTALAWARQVWDVETVEDLSGELPAAAQPYQVFGRLTLTPESTLEFSSAETP